MRLLTFDERGELQLTEDLIDNIPPYAILSHTWGADKDEVTLSDVRMRATQGKAGYAKIQFCGEQARKDKLEHFWVDTCCIDKSNSTELFEAVNSMFRWYQNAARCYVYLSDVSASNYAENAQQSELAWKSAFRASRWFTRGWTLQELLAPASVEFFTKEGGRLGDKRVLEQQIHDITKIPIPVLRGNTALAEIELEERFKWAEGRHTTREEDWAYSLLGIFGVFMPLLYGEGKGGAVRRLKKEATDAINRDDAPDRQDGKSGADCLSPDEQRWLRCLYTTDNTIHLSSIAKPVHGTCQWFLRHPKYSNWFSQDRSGLLWVSGEPGCGKSVLASFVVGELTAHAPPNTAILYFFCDDKIQKHRDAHAIMRAILYQLSIAYPGAFRRHGVPQFEKKGESVTNELKTLWDMFVSEYRDNACGNLIIIIDALDECEKSSRTRFLASITWLFTQESISPSRNWVKMLITSRPDVSIVDSLESLQEVRLKAEDERGNISQDVALVIKERLGNALGRFNTPTKVVQKLTERLTHRAGQTFLWVALVLQMIERSAEASEEALEQILVELPDELDSIYEKILARAEGRNRQKAKAILEAIVVAFEPLGFAELNFILSVRAGDGTLSNLQERLEPNMARTLHLLCGPFVKIVDSKVLLVHQTAKEFLLRRDSYGELGSVGWKHSLSPIDAHLGIGRSCVLALCNTTSRPLEASAFANYARAFWHYHLRMCEERLEPTLVDQIVSLHNLSSAGNSTISLPLTDLAFVSSVGFSRTIVQTLLDRGDPINFVDRNGMTAINFAVLGGHEKAVMFLLESGANPSSGKKGALEMALTLSDPNMVLLLLQFGAPWSSANGRRELRLAAETGHEALLSHLRAKGARMDLRINEGGEAALTIATKRGYESMVQSLLDNAQARDYAGRTALHWAAEFGYESLVRVLACDGAALDARCQFGETALLKAVKSGHFPIARLLLEYGANPDLPDKYRSTPLWWATVRGFERLVVLLLGVSNTVRKQGRTLARLAQVNGHGHIAKLIATRHSLPWPKASTKMPLLPPASVGIAMGGISTCSVVAAKVNGKEVLAAVHVGAQSCVMSIELARECNIAHLIDSRYSGTARGVGSCPTIGRVHICTVELGSISSRIAITVLDKDDIPFILGLDFLKKHQCIIDFHHNRLVFPFEGEEDREVPLFDILASLWSGESNF